MRPSRTSPALLLLLLAGCRPGPGDLHVPAPAKVQQALSRFSGLEAAVQLVPEGADPLAPVPLAAGEDAVSFSGFIDAEPGSYTLELAFYGHFEGGAARLFLGRLTSDRFTVVKGDAVTPTFSRPLDTIGRAGDAGDEDGDGLGLLDELLWGADPARADSDGDGLADGVDCQPGLSSSYAVQSGGSIEDCDGDGHRRVDLPFPGAGDDCGDEDPAVHPGAEDLCEDTIDSDCNPATCPSDDSEGPSIEIVAPAEGSVVGCHRRVQARLQDPAGVNRAEARLVDADDPTQVQERIPMRVDSGDLYVTSTLDVATQTWLVPGRQGLVVAAEDNLGNTSTAAVTFTFALEVPAVSIAPATVGAKDAPFDVTVTSAPTAGLASITLYVAPWGAGEDVVREQEVALGTQSTSPAVFTVDPATLQDGRYALYAVVEDAVGNQSRPGESFSPDGDPLAVDADYYCIFDSGEGNVPVRELVVGEVVVEPGKEPAKMRDHLDEAIAAAAARDPAAELVEIRGFGLQADGYIRLDQDAEGSGKWWRYEFYDVAADRHIEVTWYSANYDITNPEVVVTEDYPFLVGDPIAADPATLVDSDAAAAAYTAAAGCQALTGVEDEDIRYLSDQPFSAADVIRVSVPGNVNDFKATAVAPITTIWTCE
ncbi:MAG: hypothetical protein KC933_31180 [Myxococcales bacterium]|nr:hypothetical protein [Myxococcales bacterium]